MSTDTTSIYGVLLEIRNGALLAEMAAALAEISAAVHETGKAGELVLKLKVARASTRGGNQLFLADSLTTKVPQHQKEETLFFWSEDDERLTRQDPRQLRLGLHEAEVVTQRHRELMGTEEP